MSGNITFSGYFASEVQTEIIHERPKKRCINLVAFSGLKGIPCNKSQNQTIPYLLNVSFPCCTCSLLKSFKWQRLRGKRSNSMQNRKYSAQNLAHRAIKGEVTKPQHTPVNETRFFKLRTWNISYAVALEEW